MPIPKFQPSSGSFDCAFLNPSSSSKVDLIRSYLREIGRVPLLTREQEIDYGRQVQQMMSLLEAKDDLASILNCEPTITEWQAHVYLSEVELKQTLRQGERAKSKMIEANLRLVVAIAKKYSNRGLEFLDSIQEGSIGLQRAVEKFDPTKGYRFSTYAYWWIRQAITRAIAEKSRTIRLPIHITEKINKIKKAQRQLSQEMGRAPTVSEVAAELKLTPLKLLECLEWARQPISLDLRVGDDSDTYLGELLEDPGATPEEYVIHSSLYTDLEQHLAELTPQQGEVLELRYGLRGGEGMTLAEIGRSLNLSRERVRQIELKALNILRARRSQMGQKEEVAVSYGFKEAITSVDLSTSFAAVQIELFELNDGHQIVCLECSVHALI